MSRNDTGGCLEEKASGVDMVGQVAIQQQTQRSNFTMVPNILIDAYDEMSDAFRFGFIKFMRLVRKDGYFAGSISRLGKKLKVARMTVHRMVASWAKFLLVRVEPIDGIDAVRVIPLTNTLWQANTHHYQHEPVTNCDTIFVTDTSATDRAITKCDTSSQNVIEPVTNCDTVSQPQARNDPQYITNISNNKREEKRSLTNVSDARDAFPPYADGLQPQGSPLSAWLADITLMDDAFLAEMEAKLSTVSYPPVDTSYHIAPVPTASSVATSPAAIGEQAAQPHSMQPLSMATTETALQADTRYTNPTVGHATMSSAMLFPASHPILQQEAVKVTSTKETRQPAKNKKADVTPSKCDAKEVHRRINERRGYALEERVDLIRENQAIKTWCHLHTLEELEQVLDYLQQKDTYWSKPENKYRIGGITLLKETPRVLAVLAKRMQSIPIFVPPPTLEQLRAMPV